MKLIVITGSHISSVDRFYKGLIPTLEAIHAHEDVTAHYISMSKDDCIKDEMMASLSRFPKTTILLQYKKLFQFDHLAKIVYSQHFASSDRIMVIDDDDLLLSLPDWRKHSIIQGIQFVPVSITDADTIESVTVANFDAVKSGCQVVNDLSGYTAPFHLFWSYFENREPAKHKTQSLVRTFNL